MPAGSAYPSGHMVPSLLGTCLWSNCWNQFSRTCRVFSRPFTLNIHHSAVVGGWLYFSLLSDKLILKRSVETGQWSKSALCYKIIHVYYKYSSSTTSEEKLMDLAVDLKATKSQYHYHITFPALIWYSESRWISFCHEHNFKIFIHSIRHIINVVNIIFDRIAKQVRSMNWRKPSGCPSVCLSVRRQQFAFSSCFYLSFSQTINDTKVKLGEFVNINKFFSTNTKFCDLDFDFALQWTHTDIDISLFSFTQLITCMPYLVGWQALMSSSRPTLNFVTLTLTSRFSEHFLLQGHIYFSALVFSV